MTRTLKLARGESGLELTGLEWLLDHHKTKEQERRQMVADLDLHPGDRVLDLGCGPGLWSTLLGEKVLPNGSVVGIDFDSSLIEYARDTVQESPLSRIIEFRTGNFYDIAFEDGSFDLVFFGNCFSYVDDFHKALVEQKRVTRQGGRIAAKDFDGAVFIFHPIDPVLQSKVQLATARGLRENPPEPAFENYMGRKMHGMFLREGLRSVTTKSYAIQKVAPLTPEAKRYVSGNAEWYVKTGAPFLSEDEARQWRAHFDPESPACILDREDFYFCMLEVLTVGVV